MSILSTGLGLFAARLCQPLFAVVLFTAAARFLSLEIFGLYVLLMGLLFIFQQCSILGLSPVLTREISTHLQDTGKWLGGALALLLPVSVAVGGLFALLPPLVSSSPQALGNAAILAAAMPFIAFLLVAEAAFVAHGRSRAVVIQNFAENLLRTILSLALLFLGYGLPGLLIAHVLSKALGCVIAAAFLRRLPGYGRLSPDMASARFLLANARVYGGMLLISTVFMRIDIIALSILRGDAAVGIYGAAYRIVSLCFIVADSLVAAYFPVISQILLRQRDKGRDLSRAMLHLLLLLQLPMVLGLAFAGPHLLPLLFGADFAASAPALTILAFVLPFNCLSGLMGYLLNADKHERTALALLALAVAFHAGTTFWLCSKYGGAGAASGLVLATFLYGMATSIAVSRRIFPLRIQGLVLRHMLVLGVAAVFLILPGFPEPARLLGLPAALGAAWALGLVRVSQLRDSLNVLRHARGA